MLFYSVNIKYQLLVLMFLMGCDYIIKQYYDNIYIYGHYLYNLHKYIIHLLLNRNLHTFVNL